jgi:hypothetical protein
MQLQSILTCPKCSRQAVETMPTDACQFFYDCKGCGERLIMPRGRLLRVLLLRVGAVPADTEQLALLCKREAPPGLKNIPKGMFYRWNIIPVEARLGERPGVAIL